ncbi:low affinity iron permease family protein [Candidatus Saccharibacteria bacterium TM7i]|nr:low affinity iron permease family protein [Candidatus Saccharibacteria bacterium TM7i]
MKKMEKNLTKFMNKLADFIGNPKIFAVVFLVILAWFIAGLFIEYQTWFDIMDLCIFVSTFFLLFVVQSSQNADTQAIQDKLDELIEALPGADTNKKREEKQIKKGEKK